MPGGAPIGRRDVLRGAAALGLSALGAARLRRSAGAARLRRSAVPAGAARSGASEPPTASLRAAASPVPASPSPSGLVGYAFNAKTQDVTLFDPATLQVVATKPLGAV